MKKMHNLSQIASSKFTFSVLESAAAAPALATASASAYAMVSSRRCGSHDGPDGKVVEVEDDLLFIRRSCCWLGPFLLLAEPLPLPAVCVCMLCV